MSSNVTAKIDGNYVFHLHPDGMITVAYNGLWNGGIFQSESEAREAVRIQWWTTEEDKAEWLNDHPNYQE